jgi:P-type conjugative transfer ATPase TrbB
MPIDDPNAERDHRHVESMTRSLGPDLLAALADDDVTEIYGNADGRLWLDTHSSGRRRAPFSLPALRIEAFLNAAASYLGSEPLNVSRPQLQAELPTELFRGARLQGFVPPVTAAPAFNLRKRPALIYTLDDLVRQGILGPRHRATLAEAVRNRTNVLVAGGTGTGKTTFVNALLQEITTLCPADRVVVLEDTAELQCAAEDHLSLRTRAGLTLTDLVTATLRTSPDRIVVGEVRDGAALALLDAWGTGHPGGCTTLHASDTPGALRRLDRLAQRNAVPSQLELIVETIGLVVMLEGGNLRRRVREVVRVLGLTPEREPALETIDPGDRP